MNDISPVMIDALIMDHSSSFTKERVNPFPETEYGFLFSFSNRHDVMGRGVHLSHGCS